MHHIITNWRSILTLAVILIAGTGCNGKTAGHSSGATTIAGREISFSIDGAGAIQSQSDAATISFESHKVRVEKERLLIDDKEQAKIAPTVSKVEVLVSNATVTVMADSANIFTTQITR